MSDGKDHPSKCNTSLMVRLRIAIRKWTYLAQKVIDIGTFAFSIAMKILGPCLILVAHGLYTFVAYTWLFHVIPMWMDDDWTLGLPGIAGVTIVGAFILFNILYNYWHAICLNAGTPGSYEQACEVAAANANPEGGKKEKVRQCHKCNLHKPERAHHCSVCRRCVMKMDHHCPWINNCVGYMNYRYFCLFKLFTAIGCVYLMVIFAYNFDDIVMYTRRRRGTRQARQDILTCFTVCGSVLMALCGLGGFHVYLVLTNQTTIEFQTNLLKRRQARQNGEYFRNTYDLGRNRNFQQVFGPNAFCRFMWLFPYLNNAPTGDGLTYPSLRARVT